MLPIKPTLLLGPTSSRHYQASNPPFPLLHTGRILGEEVIVFQLSMSHAFKGVLRVSMTDLPHLQEDTLGKWN